MKKIIDGKIYNTETATKIATYWNRLSVSDFNNMTEWLYRTSKGTWFLAGEGGALSPYSTSLEGGRCSGAGERISPLTDDEAREWLERHNEIDALETYFKEILQEA